MKKKHGSHTLSNTQKYERYVDIVLSGFFTRFEGFVLVGLYVSMSILVCVYVQKMAPKLRRLQNQFQPLKMEEQTSDVVSNLMIDIFGIGRIIRKSCEWNLITYL